MEESISTNIICIMHDCGWGTRKIRQPPQNERVTNERNKKIWQKKKIASNPASAVAHARNARGKNEGPIVHSGRIFFLFFIRYCQGKKTFGTWAFHWRSKSITSAYWKSKLMHFVFIDGNWYAGIGSVGRRCCRHCAYVHLAGPGGS